MENLNVEEKTEEEIVERVRNAIANGASSISEVFRRTGLYPYTLYRLEREGRIKLPRGKRDHKINLESFLEEIKKGERSIEKLCEIWDFKSPHSMWAYCTKHNLPWPENPIPYRTWLEVDVLIDKGLPITEIGKKFSRSRELIRQYINASGQYKYWKGKRDDIVYGLILERENLIQARSIFLSAVRARTEELAKEKDWATQKAVEYLDSYKRIDERNYSFDILYSVFKRYEEALKKGKKLSLSRLAEESGLKWASPTRRILAGVGLEPMHGKRAMARKVKIDAVKRGFNLDLSSRDVGYFLEHPEDNAAEIFSRMGKRVKTHFEIGRLGREYLTWSRASQIYEAQDAGFNEDEITELLDTNYDIVEYAISCRDEGIENKLIKDLRILFNDKTIKTPYVTREIREKLGQDIVN